MTITSILDSTTLRDLVARLGVTPSRLTPFTADSPLFKQSTPSRGTAAMPVVDSALELLRTAHTARVLVQLDLVLESEVFDHLVCFSDSGSSVLLSPGPAGLVVRGPTPVDELVEAVSNYFGSSLLRAVPFAATVDARAAGFLTAALDLERRRALRELAGSAEPGPASFDAATLLAALAQGPPSFHSLTSVLAAVTGRPPAVDPAAADGALGALSQAGLVGAGPAGYSLAGDALAFARRFLVLGSMLRVRVARENGAGELHHAALWFVQAGVHDVLMLELVDSSLSLEALSAAAVLEAVRRLVSDPEALGPRPAAGPTQATHGTQLMPAFPQR